MSCLRDGLAGLSTGELVTTIEAVAAELALRAAPESGTAAMEYAETLGRSIDLAEAGLATLVRQVDACGAHQQWGFPSAVAWLRSRLGMRHGRAAEKVTMARQLPRLHRTAKMLSAGQLSAAFAATICTATPRLDDTDATAAEDILLTMVQQGCTVQQVAKAADRITDLIRDRNRQQPEPQDSRRGFTRSWLQRAKSLDGGSWIKGWLTPEHSAAFDAIIGPLAKPKAHGDDRDLAQRTADATMSVLTQGNKGAGVTIIIDLAAYTTTTGDPGPYTHPTPDTHLPSHSNPPPDTSPTTAETHPPPTTHPGTNPTADATSTTRPAAPTNTRSSTDAPTSGSPTTTSSLAGTSSATTTGSPTRTGTAAGMMPPADSHTAANTDTTPTSGSPTATRPRAGVDSGGGAGAFEGDARCRCGGARGGGVGAARLLDGSAISAQDARRIALNAGINTLLLGPDGLPLYLGRTVRFVTPAQRKALLALYDSCVVQDCPIPAHLCEIHHLDGGWKLGTRTDINKLVPACGWHNRWFEDNPDQITQTQDTRGRTVLTIQKPQPWKKAANTTTPGKPSASNEHAADP